MAAPFPDQDDLARVTAYGCAYDPRFAYYVYAPRNWLGPERPERYRLVVLIHGSERGAEMYRNNFKAFAERTNSVILAPLFPAGLIEPDRLENYNLLRWRGVEFDTILCHMIEEVGRRFPLDPDGIYLHGFSAGAQFAHRFFYNHPELLRAVSIGAPGQTTLLDDRLAWPLGIADAEALFGRVPDLDRMRRVPVQIVVGAEDRHIHSPEARMSRLELNRELFQHYRDFGFQVRFDLVPAAAHEGFKLIFDVMLFFDEIMREKGLTAAA